MFQISLQGHLGEFEPGKVQYSTPKFVDQLFLIRAYWNPKSRQGPNLLCREGPARILAWISWTNFIKNQFWMIYVESQHSQSINADSKNMLTHCVYQLANFEMKKARVITDTHSLPTFFFSHQNFFLSRQLFPRTHSQICWISWKKSPYKFIGKTLSLHRRALRIEMNTSEFLLSVNAGLAQWNWDAHHLQCKCLQGFLASISFSEISLEKGSKNHKEPHTPQREILYMLQGIL